MPERRSIRGRNPNSINARDLFAREGIQTRAERRSGFRDRFSLKRIGAVVSMAAGLMVSNHNLTMASTNIYIPGTGGGGTPIEQADHQVRIDYSAKTPIIDDMPGSIDEAVLKTEAAVDTAGSGDVTVEGYSQGAAAATSWAQEYGAEHTNVTLRTEGDPCQEQGGIQTMNPWLDVLTGDTCGNETTGGLEKEAWCNESDLICDSPDFAALASTAPDKAAVQLIEGAAGYAIRHSDYDTVEPTATVNVYQPSENSTIHYVDYEDSAIVDVAEEVLGADMPQPLKDTINTIVDDSKSGNGMSIPVSSPTSLANASTPIFDMLNAQFGNPLAR